MILRQDYALFCDYCFGTMSAMSMNRSRFFVIRFRHLNGFQAVLENLRPLSTDEFAYQLLLGIF